MRNDVKPLLDAYATCLAGILPVYQVSVDDKQTGNYILLRMESETDLSDKNKFVTSPVIIIDIVTRHEGAIDASVVEGYDNEVRQAIWPTRRTTGLADWIGAQVTMVNFEGANYIDSFDGARYEHRKITRLSNRLNQL